MPRSATVAEDALGRTAKVPDLAWQRRRRARSALSPHRWKGAACRGGCGTLVSTTDVEAILDVLEGLVSHVAIPDLD